MLQNQDRDKKAACFGSIIFILGTDFIIFGTITSPMLNIVDDKRKQTLGKHGKPITAYYRIPLPIKEGLNQKFILCLAAGEKSAPALRVVWGKRLLLQHSHCRQSQLQKAVLSQSKEACCCHGSSDYRNRYWYYQVYCSRMDIITVFMFGCSLQYCKSCHCAVSENLSWQLNGNVYLMLRSNCCITGLCVMQKRKG